MKTQYAPHNPKLSQEKRFMFYVYSRRLFKICSKKEAVDSFFRKVIQIKSWKYKMYWFSDVL